MVAAAKLPPIVFFNIGWMREYAGAVVDDPTTGRHGHLQNNAHGGEACNFSPFRDRYFGYRPPAENRINIDRLGAARGAASVDGVTVVWMALRPRSSETLVVGWYRNATVFRDTQSFRGARSAPSRVYPDYMTTAAVSDSRLLPVQARNFQVSSVHRVEGGFGQSPTYYDDQDLYRTKVHKYITAIEANVVAAAAARPTGRRPPRNHDPEQRRLVEERAVKHAKDFYESDEGGGWNVKSVENEARGWDLECRRGSELLLVEVKGRSGTKVNAEITPNEYTKMRDKAYRSSYVLYVVTDCLSDIPVASLFRNVTANLWQTADGRKLKIEERTAAVVSC